MTIPAGPDFEDRGSPTRPRGPSRIVALMLIAGGVAGVSVGIHQATRPYITLEGRVTSQPACDENTMSYSVTTGDGEKYIVNHMMPYVNQEMNRYDVCMEQSQRLVPGSILTVRYQPRDINDGTKVIEVNYTEVHLDSM